ncbi:dipeptide transport system substrate-binding protein [Andreprevotia lacus DSM 23236]|jgi:dipeptide transport system substrate-binding protein|uniref:Dipeptide transport system substrate-binding protein n=1 Tax=Andreprevotia lacus DSM 23236 TaxID=1121001 RepID=A0A1W1XRC6_9NEIS|nr:ABC transporter substrate-binding protein [Andreprevotia lacus]SMC26539.1 dipeptide transport system substrate-binding protein [Andreprevotia lacus DSM 23236]
MRFAPRQLALALAITLAAGTAAAAGKTLIFCSEGSPAGFDPARYTTSTDFDASAETVFNRLSEFEPGSTKVRPGLAEKWSVSADGLTYTFNLRKGVKFHTTAYFKPTRDFNADDAVFTLQRLIDKNLPFNKAAPAEYSYATDMGLDTNIVAVSKLDPYTVQVKLKAVDAAFIQNLAMSFASVQSAEYAEQLLKAGKANMINVEPVGTGPFVFKSYQKDAAIRFEANPGYWRKDEVKLDKLIFAITPDASVRYQKLQKNECQVMAYPRPADLKAMQANPQLAVASQAGFNEGWIAYNVKHKPLDKLEVRQALDMAINKKAIIDAVYQGAGQLATNPMPPTQWSFNKTLKDAPLDVAKAKSLLAKAGVGNGFEITLWAMPVQRPYNPNAKLMAEMIQADWAKIGVKAKIVTYEWGEYIKRSKGGEHDAMTIGWTGDNGDPDNWLGVNLGCEAVGGNNYSQWCDKKFDDLVVKARSLSNQAERTKLYEQAQVVFKEQVPFTPIAHSTVYVPMRKEVTGYKISPFGLTSFYGVGLK